MAGQPVGYCEVDGAVWYTSNYFAVKSNQGHIFNPVTLNPFEGFREQILEPVMHDYPIKPTGVMRDINSKVRGKLRVLQFTTDAPELDGKKVWICKPEVDLFPLKNYCYGASERGTSLILCRDLSGEPAGIITPIKEAKNW